MPETIPVYFVMMPDCLLLDVAGPADALRFANQELIKRGETARFDMHFVAPHACGKSSVGLQFAGLEALPGVLPDNAWIVLPGGWARDLGVGADKENRSIVSWLRQAVKPNLQQVITICAGALYAAAAGLLDGRRCTTHHGQIERLRALAPRAEVLENHVFVEDGCVASSAGVTAGIDLALHLIARHIDPACAARVAQSMVVYLRRGPLDPELSPFLAHRNHLHAAVHRVQDAICADPQQPWNITTMAAAGCVSPRHLTRIFSQHTGVSPLDYLRNIRLTVAERAIKQGASRVRAAEIAGFSSDQQLRRARHRPPSLLTHEA
ncbi:DJ-1/PfpI family protein [Uliginosibacterium sp. 31-16]|uniref:GlxA family transcriptional regulator n=1 Tax=Uliginosibacterium sp. 31-16 TaxID=3068315 RepID=UPI00273E087F|nr:helix-turn-helix domain-containing protein [Uliginosibacterium sp. 31-16]MDP5240308.1 DJ-1/PfpI family protein [Uliginosibacterium sp. 31-16]